jgi:hypothetical protein
MFICRECGQEYKTKPNYCECGNDTFDEVGTNKKEREDILKKYEISPFALWFFVCCIVLSILTLLFFPPISQTKPQQKHETVTLKPATEHIPDINTFWKNEPVQPAVEEVVQIEEPKVITKTITVYTTPPQKKTEQIKTQTTQKTQIKQQTKQATANQTTAQTKQNSRTISDRAEVTNYKIALRKKLFSNLSVGSIQGSGKCGIEFSVDSTGKLINRGFTFQSDNKSVNDEVYKMMMRTPTYTPPPSSYKGEKIRLIFEFDNGTFAVSFN